MKYYHQILQNKLNKHKSFTSEIEKAIISAIDAHNINESFDILIFLDKYKEFYHCECEVNNQTSKKRYRIKEMKSFNYSEDLNFILPDVKNSPLYVYGELAYNPRLMKKLKEKYGKVIENNESENLDLNSRTHFLDIINKEKINLFDLQTTVRNHLSNNPLPVFVPADKETLKSKFWQQHSWEEIVPKDCSTCSIGEVKCHYLKISFEIDGFNNVFCIATDESGHESYTLLFAPFGCPQKEGEQNSLKKKSNTSSSDKQEEESFTASNTNQISIYSPDRTTNQTPQNIPDFSVRDLPASNIDYQDGDPATIYDILGDHVCDTDLIIVEDNYMHSKLHIGNLDRMIEAVNRRNAIRRTRGLRHLHLVTTKTNDKRYTSTQEEGLKKLKDKYLKVGIGISIEFVSDKNKHHDRKIILRNGWTIRLGRGLDMFKSPTKDNPVWTCKTANVAKVFNEQEDEKLTILRQQLKL